MPPVLCYSDEDVEGSILRPGFIIYPQIETCIHMMSFPGVKVQHQFFTLTIT